MTPRVHLITTCFPPNVGGIEQYCYGLFRELPPESVTVSALDTPGAAAFDREQPFRIIRHAPLVQPGLLSRLVPDSRKAVYLPVFPGEPVSDNRGLLRRTAPPSGRWSTIRAAVRSARQILDLVQPDVVCLSSAFPLAHLAAGLKTSHGLPCVSFTHGIEASVASIPPERRVLRRVSTGVDVLVAVCRWTADRIGRVVGNHPPVQVIDIGVDVHAIHPALDGSVMRARHGLGNVPLCACVGRLVPRKGQDRLIAAWPRVVRRVPDARLVIVGPGPLEQRLRRLAARSPCADRIVVTGEVPRGDLPLYLAAANVFAMPSRTRLGGLDIEGPATVYLEAAAAGLPVVVGRSGGAPDTVVDGVTGVTVDGQSPAAVASAVSSLLGDPERARAMGQAGRRRVEREYTPAHSAHRLSRIVERLVKE